MSDFYRKRFKTLKNSRSLSKLLVLLTFLTFPAAAEKTSIDTNPLEQIHWSLASFFGTGWYQVEGNRSTFVLHMPFSLTMSRPNIGALQKRVLKSRLMLPVSFGFHQLDRGTDILDKDNYATFAFIPGYEVDFFLSSRWTLKPQFHLGVGYEKDTSSLAKIWYAGIKTKYRLSDSNTNEHNFIGSISTGGSNPEFEKRSRYSAVLIGIESSFRMTQWVAQKRPLNLHFHANYSELFDQLDFHLSPEQSSKIHNQWEVGIGVGRIDKVLSWWLLSFDRIGLAFQSDTSQKFEAIKIFFSSTYDR